MTHTPEPWRVIRKVGWTIYPEEKGATYIAFMNEAREESGDNARLMAVAPEMLKALELVQKYWSPNPHLSYELEAFEEAEQAIIKAKGE